MLFYSAPELVSGLIQQMSWTILTLFYIILQVFNAAAVVLVWFTMVETKQRSLAQIQAQLVNPS